MSYVPPSNTGLKNQWGVGDPKMPVAPGAPNAPNPGSEKQAQDFKAAFEKALGAINEHLQYTAANAEASKHAAVAGRRDARYPAFQAALGKVDRTDPSKGQAAIDKVLGDTQALGNEVAAFHARASTTTPCVRSKSSRPGRTPRRPPCVAWWTGFASRSTSASTHRPP